MQDRIKKWPVVPVKATLPDGSWVKLLIIPMPGGSMVCDEFGHPMGMRQPGVSVTAHEMALLFHWGIDDGNRASDIF